MSIKNVLKWIMGFFYIFAGILHFKIPEFYVKIMPSYLPYHFELVYLSGFFEILLGALFLIPKYTKIAAWGIILLLIAVFPANINMAIHHIVPSSMENLSYTTQQIILWARLPFQGILILWAYWYTKE
ncbi:MAG: membrane protein [Leptospiraceae bacterium]|nr:MAG: membrane protein [Leptospiraceae bacterium]